MDKAKTSVRRKKSLVKLIEHDPSVSLKNRKAVLDALIQCLLEDDVDTFRDGLIAYLRTASKTNLATKTKIGRQTLYDLMDEKKTVNPTLSTLAPIFKSLAV